MKKNDVKPVKIKNKTAGLPSNAPTTIGVIVQTIVAAIQFVIVTKGTMLAGTISGTYNQVIGPIVSPNKSI
jgi:hypothetical protein